MGARAGGCRGTGRRSLTARMDARAGRGVKKGEVWSKNKAQRGLLRRIQRRRLRRGKGRVPLGCACRGEGPQRSGAAPPPGAQRRVGCRPSAQAAGPSLGGGSSLGPRPWPQLHSRSPSVCEGLHQLKVVQLQLTPKPLPAAWCAGGGRWVQKTRWRGLAGFGGEERRAGPTTAATSGGCGGPTTAAPA